MKTTKRIAAAIMSMAIMLTANVCAIPSNQFNADTSIVMTASAASVRKCYTIATTNTPVYAKTNLTSKIGSIFPTDEIVVNDVTSKYTKVTYPVGNGRTKTGYIATSAILTATSGSTKKASRKCTTYIRANTSKSYGYIDKGDSCIILGKSNGMVQLKYPVSGGYKYAFVTQSDYNQCFNVSPTPPVDNNLYFPLKGKITRSSNCKTNGQYCDYQAKSGTPVYAPCDGTVTFRQTYATNCNKLASYGNNFVFTSSNNQYKVIGAHLTSFNNVKLKYSTSLSYPCSASKYSCKTVTLTTRKVKKGELIGYTGMTGNASGPHLHLELYQNGKAVNPASAFKTW